MFIATLSNSCLFVLIFWTYYYTINYKYKREHFNLFKFDKLIFINFNFSIKYWDFSILMLSFTQVLFQIYNKKNKLCMSEEKYDF